MTEKRQQQTLSVRITDSIRHRLERAKQLTAARTGRSVSTSDIAKQLLESAREDRLEVVDLLDSPTETLLQIRRKGDAGMMLSRAEWTVLAYFVLQGLESGSSKTPNAVSRDALATVLDAFIAVYNLRTEPAPTRDAYYLGNLPGGCRPAAANGGDRGGQTGADLVRRTVTEARRCVSDPATALATEACLPLAGRNLFTLLDDEPLAGNDAINRALRPYWSVLWSLAARGHYALTHEPVREPATHQDGIYELPIPPITEGPYTLSFARGEGNDFSVLVSFPGPRGARYPIRGYPAVSEFCAMLTALAPHGPTRAWNGRYFVADVIERQEEGDTVFWFRAHDNGITFGVSAEDWQCLRTLVRRAWDLPDIRMARVALVREYGEL